MARSPDQTVKQAVKAINESTIAGDDYWWDEPMELWNAGCQIEWEINKAEAAHKNMFVAGWRPFVGWTCGIALAWHFVGQPLAVFVIVYSGVESPPLPTFEMESLLTVLLGMLGLGGLRTFEKTKGVSREK